MFNDETAYNFSCATFLMDKPTVNPRKILRSPSLKRRSKAIPITERVKLEKVLGLTVSSNSAFGCDQNSGIVVYPAGCTVVLYNTKRNKQTHIINQSKKTLTAVAISADGKHVVTGECGHLPALRIWDTEEHVQVAEFLGHKFGINCVAFSPNSKYVVSIGTQHDSGVNVWDWRNNLKIAANKVSSKVKAVSFAENGSYFVTVGNRHVKFWYLEHSRSKIKEAVPLMGRSAILGDQRNNYFCDVACGKGQMADSTYCITQSGLLCEFNNRRLLDKWVELRTQSANCLCVGEDYIFIGCADGVIRVFSPYTLHFITSFPRPHHLGVDVAGGLTPNHIGLHPANAKFPDTIAITFDENHNKVSCIYNDHSFYVWDVTDTKKIGKAASFLYHSACIWGVEIYPDLPEEQSPALPPGSFLTCSSDDTIRIWNLEPHLSSDVDLKRNMYSQELLKTIYLDEELVYIRDVDYNPAGSNDKTDVSYDGKNGIRAIQVSPEGRHLASGDRSGNIRIHDLRFMDEVCHIEAHDSEVLCLEYSKPETGHRLLASASRDRLIHVFDADQEYSFQQTLDDHSSSITAVRFTSANNQLQMMSCGADKSIIFRTAQFNPELKFYLNHQVMAKNTIYDMEIDASRKYVLTACQDRNIRVYNIRTSKQTRVFRGAVGDDGTLIEIELDPSGTYVATSCSDKNLALFDFFSGECVANMSGHSELITGLKFTNDCRHLISVSGDSCMFVWKLSSEFTHNMQSRLVQLGKMSHSDFLLKDNIRRDSYITIPKPSRADDDTDPEADVNDNFAVHSTNLIDGEEDDEYGNRPDYRFSVGPLPSWAKKQVSADIFSSNSREDSSILRSAAVQPRGRWAQRMDNQGLIVKSQLDQDNGIQLSYTDLRERRRYTLEDESELPAKPKVTLPIIPQFQRRTVFWFTTESGQNESYEERLDDLQRKSVEIVSKLKASEGNVTFTRGSELLQRKLSVGEESTSLSRSSSNTSFRFEDLENDGDMEDNDNTEVIYYPPTEDNSECGDSNPGSFKVFAISVSELNEKPKNFRKHRADDIETSEASMSSYDSEPYGENNSEEEFEEPDYNSSPISQPPMARMTERQYFGSMENLDNSTLQDKYIINNFDNQFSPSSRDRFEQTMKTLEKQLVRNQDTINARESISTRFLTHSTTSLRNVALHNATLQRRSGIITVGREAVSKRKADLNKEVEERKKRMEALGWKAGQEKKTKSTIDLRNLTEKGNDSRNRNNSGGSGMFDLRKACSMSDLSSARTRRRTLPSVPSRLDLTKGGKGDSSRSTSRERSTTVLSTSNPPRKRSEGRIPPGTLPTSSPTHRPRTAPSSSTQRAPSYAKSTESSIAKAVSASRVPRSSSLYSLESPTDDCKISPLSDVNRGRSSTASSPSRNRIGSGSSMGQPRTNIDTDKNKLLTKSSTNIAGKVTSTSTKKSNKDPNRRNTVAVTSASFKEMMKSESSPVEKPTEIVSKTIQSRPRSRSKSAERKQSSINNEEKTNSTLSNTRAKIEFFSQVQHKNKTQQNVSPKVYITSEKADRFKDSLSMPPPPTTIAGMKSQHELFFRKGINGSPKWKSVDSISGEKDDYGLDKSPQDLPEKDLNPNNSTDKKNKYDGETYPEKLGKETVVSKWSEQEDKSLSSPLINRQPTYSPIHSSSLLIKTTPKKKEQSTLNVYLGEDCKPSTPPRPADNLEYCKAAAKELQMAVEKATQAYQRIVTSSTIPIEEKAEMLAVFSESFCTAQETLCNTTKIGEWSPTVASLFTPNRLMSLKEQLVQQQNKGTEDVALKSTVTLLQQYSDMLLNLVQQKIEPEQKKS